jgi:tRNA G18 (ribose-2'-O)-methylase SpoU
MGGIVRSAREAGLKGLIGVGQGGGGLVWRFGSSEASARVRVKRQRRSALGRAAHAYVWLFVTDEEGQADMAI